MSDLPLMPEFPFVRFAGMKPPQAEVKVGMDLVLIKRMQLSADKFGDRFLRRVFTDHEIEYARSSEALIYERLAARFAAKEAAIKAFGFAHQGVNWRDMEVWRAPDGHCDLRLHGKALQLTQAQGVTQSALSLSHDGDYAAALLVAMAMPMDPD